VDQSRAFEITKQEVLTAYKKVKANKGSAGCDGKTIEGFDKDVKNNLYKIWNRLSSGCYFPQPVKLVEIPKLDGTKRPLGIPTVSDRIAQQVVKARLEPNIDNVFHEDSFGYRPNKSAHDAIAKARQRCWQFNWCVDLDIKGFFDNINHELLLKAVRKHTTCKWIVLYVERWLTAPVQLQDGSLKPRAKGTPQGGVISPLLANLYLHYVFDKWVHKHFPKILFERYADDIVIHCRTNDEAKTLLRKLEIRFNECHLEINNAKTQITYCRDSNRKLNYPGCQFDFLGYTFGPRKAINKAGKYFVSFSPAASKKATTLMRKRLKMWLLHRQVSKTIDEIADIINPTLRGWINYYGKFYPSALVETYSCLNRRLAKWASRKFKHMRGRKSRAAEWLMKISSQRPNLFYHWQGEGKAAFHW
jgi:RNA-directed DNA polymerase